MRFKSERQRKAAFANMGNSKGVKSSSVNSKRINTARTNFDYNQKKQIEIVDSHDIKMIAENRGSHYFSPSTMRFFDSRLAGTGYRVDGNIYFITSEQFHGTTGSSPRKYSIRMMKPSGDVVTVGEFQEYGSLGSAKYALQKSLNELIGES